MCSAPVGQVDLDLDVRVGELILLDAMYPDQCAWDQLEIQQAISEQNYNYNHIHQGSISFTFKCDKQLDLIVTLDPGYPGQPVGAHCRLFDGQLPNSVQRDLNQQISDYITDCTAGLTADVCSVVQRVQELWTDLKVQYMTINDTTLTTNDVSKKVPGPQQLARYWIYSHHIKSSKKRQMIIDLAQELHLNGVTCVGKPGFICVEGLATNCEDFWQQIRATNWQRITLIDQEQLDPDPNLRHMAFDDYHELANTSQLFRHLELHRCDQIVKNFLGFQSSVTTTTSTTSITTSTVTITTANTTTTSSDTLGDTTCS